MIRKIVLLCVLILGGIFTVNSCAGYRQVADAQTDQIADLIGDWSGESVCVDKEKFPGCNDEKVVYHITRVAGKSNTVSLAADKIVNGKPDPMGTIEFVFDPKKQTLTGEFQNSRTHIVMELQLKADVLDGTMKELPGGDIARRMTVKKVSKAT